MSTGFTTFHEVLDALQELRRVTRSRRDQMLAICSAATTSHEVRASQAAAQMCDVILLDINVQIGRLIAGPGEVVAA